MPCFFYSKRMARATDVARVELGHRGRYAHEPLAVGQAQYARLPRRTPPCQERLGVRVKGQVDKLDNAMFATPAPRAPPSQPPPLPVPCPDGGVKCRPCPPLRSRAAVQRAPGGDMVRRIRSRRRPARGRGPAGPASRRYHEVSTAIALEDVDVGVGFHPCPTERLCPRCRWRPAACTSRGGCGRPSRVSCSARGGRVVSVVKVQLPCAPSIDRAALPRPRRSSTQPQSSWRVPPATRGR